MMFLTVVKCFLTVICLVEGKDCHRTHLAYAGKRKTIIIVVIIMPCAQVPSAKKPPGDREASKGAGGV